MARTHQVVVLALLGAVASACTPGGLAGTPLGGGSQSGVTTIDINLSQSRPSEIPAGESGGFSPAVTTVAVGSVVRFVNTDSFAHTATAIPGATTFPSGSPFNSSAQTRSGEDVSSVWSSGTLEAGTASQPISIDRPGTYLFGCFYHYGAPMRGEIVAQ